MSVTFVDDHWDLDDGICLRDERVKNFTHRRIV